MADPPIREDLRSLFLDLPDAPLESLLREQQSPPGNIVKQWADARKCVKEALAASEPPTVSLRWSPKAHGRRVHVVNCSDNAAWGHVEYRVPDWLKEVAGTTDAGRAESVEPENQVLVVPLQTDKAALEAHFQSLPSGDLSLMLFLRNPESGRPIEDCWVTASKPGWQIRQCSVKLGEVEFNLHHGSYEFTFDTLPGLSLRLEIAPPTDIRPSAPGKSAGPPQSS